MTAPADPPLIDPDGLPVGQAEIEAALARIAPFYDLDLGALADALPLSAAYAQLAGPAVLEVGVGTGRVAAHLAAAGCRVVGIDASPAMLAQARQRFAAGPTEGVTLVQADIRRPPSHPALAPGAFDLVAAPLAGLCHLLTRHDQLAALRNVARLLRPGGLVAGSRHPPPAMDPHRPPQRPHGDEAGGRPARPGNPNPVDYVSV